MSEFESCTYMGGLCKVRGTCLIEGTMRNQMGDGKSWTDPNSERVNEKIAQFIETARESKPIFFAKKRMASPSLHFP